MQWIVEHKLGREEALKRILNLIATLKQDYKDMIEEFDMQTEDYKIWLTVKAKGFKVKASINVADDNVKADVSIPFILKPLVSSYEEEALKKVKQILE